MRLQENDVMPFLPHSLLRQTENSLNSLFNPISDRKITRFRLTRLLKGRVLHEIVQIALVYISPRAAG